ncbi:S9 family peptidase [Sporosarcina sp. Te-1]|uniref:alpha/beta hydrolase family protein n=1 Tax=Sporosarcina sp. Te-1 TaxID=2818390 RepID=UPI001A9FE55A|nr:alpha/beta fold hydrolase [Sporosarcina sp. Te-1]QTD42055.1 prolyl oligopeptidase family serine peptidase [Sporosarcina sp. Te-1]
MRRIVIDNQTINHIPILSIYQEGLTKYPLIFFLHGYGANREQALDFGYMLAQKGFYYVSIDCKDHGARISHNNTTKFTHVFPPDSGLDTYVHMHEVIEQTYLDIQVLIAYYKIQSEIDSTRIGISGFSMGGYAAFYIAANNPNIKTLVSIAGKPAFTKAWEDSILSIGTYEQWKDQIQEAAKEIDERTEYMRRLDPFEKLSRFAPKPLLMINGDLDTDSLFTYSLELYKSLLPLYRDHPDNLRIDMPFVNHQFSYEMKRNVCNWLVEHLSD